MDTFLPQVTDPFVSTPLSVLTAAGFVRRFNACVRVPHRVEGSTAPAADPGVAVECDLLHQIARTVVRNYPSNPTPAHRCGLVTLAAITDVGIVCEVVAALGGQLESANATPVDVLALAFAVRLVATSCGGSSPSAAAGRREDADPDSDWQTTPPDAVGVTGTVDPDAVGVLQHHSGLNGLAASIVAAVHSAVIATCRRLGAPQAAVSMPHAGLDLEKHLHALGLLLDSVVDALATWPLAARDSKDVLGSGLQQDLAELSRTLRSLVPGPQPEHGVTDNTESDPSAHTLYMVRPLPVLPLMFIPVLNRNGAVSRFTCV